MRKRVSKKAWIGISLAVLFLGLVIWTVWGNTALERNAYVITSEKLPLAFDGYRIAQVSDLHNAEMGDGNATLLAMLKDSEPDIIAITGDLIDSNRPDLEICLQFVREVATIAPCYYVTGNHEAWVFASVYERLEQEMITAGIQVLHNEEILLERDGEQLSIIGIDDPSFAMTHGDSDVPTTVESIEKLSAIEGFTILLVHRPQDFKQYAAADVDLILSGHIHGGQFRLPFIGGLIAPSREWFPAYDAGLYVEDDTHMIVSRGIGNSVIPMRFNNRPELIIIDLQSRE